MKNDKEAVSYLQWHSNRKLLAGLFAEKTIGVWDFNTPKKDSFLLTSKSTGFITSLEWFAKKAKCATLDSHGGIEIWDCKTKKSVQIKVPLAVSSIAPFKDTIVAFGKNSLEEFKIKQLNELP